jgi:transcriptional regulator with XRE-family HTH domain
MRKPHAAQVRKDLSPEAAFGRVLREIRQGRSVSQEELAARSGYHRTYIGQLERGEKSPSLRTIFNLAGSLDTTPSKVIASVEREVDKFRN